MPPVNNPISGRMVVTKPGQVTARASAKYAHELLLESLMKKMTPFHTTVRARSTGEFECCVRHDGEEFLYVLTGIIMFYTEFYDPIELRRGDSVYYDTTTGHNLVSASQDDANILWVTSLA